MPKLMPLVIALISALAGGAISYVFVPNTDPEVKALLKRRVELAEKEASERERAREAAERIFAPIDQKKAPTSGGQQMQPRW